MNKPLKKPIAKVMEMPKFGAPDYLTPERIVTKLEIYTVSQKRVPPSPWLQLCQCLIDLLNSHSFTAVKSTTFPTKLILDYPPRLKHVAALP